jgi:NADH dehydrogenase FAD-containing subunit
MHALPCALHPNPVGIELLVNSRVLSVESGSVKVADKHGSETDIPFGACVWSTGIGMHPLIQQIQQAFPGVQTHNRCVVTVYMVGVVVVGL